MNAEETHLLADMEINLVQASGGKRFFNYLIDIIFFYALIFGVTFMEIALNPASIDAVNDSADSDLLYRIAGLCLYALYMAVMESLFKGKSLGKLITGTRAINEDGTRINFGTAMIRSFSRLVPFEAFSALGSPSYPWHDKWSHSYVIDEKSSVIPAGD